MLHITDYKVYNRDNAVLAAGLSMRTDYIQPTPENLREAEERCNRLVRASALGNVHCHDNFLTGILISFNVRYPQYWSMEFQRYHFVQIVTSSSKMHRLPEMDFEMNVNEYVDRKTREHMKFLIEQFRCIKANQDKYSPEEYEKIIYAARMRMFSNCPMGLELVMHVTTNYKQLQTIYQQRDHHLLKEDWGNFRQWCEQLPDSQWITLKDIEK